MIDKVALYLAGVGMVLSVGVHIAAWAGWAPGFGVVFPLFVGCLLTWSRAFTTAHTTFRLREAGTHWDTVTSHAPRWVGRAYQPLTYYFMIYFLWVFYVGVVQRAEPSRDLMARFFSSGALVFYYGSAAYLWATGRAGHSAGKGASEGETP